MAFRFEITRAPSAIASIDLTGTWIGAHHVVECLRVCGQGPSICEEDIAPPGVTFKVQLILHQSGADVSGTLDFYNNTGGRIVESGGVFGSLSDTGALTLSGTTYSTDPSEPSHTVLSDWSSQLAPDGSLTGSFTEHEFFENFWGPQQVQEKSELVNVRRAS